MKHITSSLLALASFIASLSHAQVLPKPVFSTAPATVRLVVKNPNGQLYNSIGLFYNTFASMDNSYFTLVSQNGGTQVYEAKADVDMTVLAKMRYSRSRKHKESVPADIVLVPGKTTTVEYDGETGKLKFKGPFAKLNEEITKYTEDEAKYSYIRIFNYNPNVATDTIDRHTPEDMHRICNFNFQEAERDMAADKKISAEFKEWWKCYMVNEFSYAMQTYTYKYTKAMPDWGPQTNGKPIEAYYTLEHIADPAFGNAIFYQRKNSYTTRLFDLYEKYSGTKLQMSEEAGRLRKAYDADWRIRSSNNFFLKQKLDLICNELPEYKPAMQKIVKDLHEHMETEEGKPVVGNFCTLDRTLEGEDIMKELLAKYRNGKPTIVGIYDYGPNSFASILQNELGNEVNFVYLTGGKYSNEDAFFSNLKNSRGDFYYLMNYQIEYLHKRYRKIKGRSRIIVIAFDADGNMILNPEEFNQSAWIKQLREALQLPTIPLKKEKSRVLAHLIKATKYSQTMPQEKVYLHFDNTGYFEGETIWFKAYVTRTDDGGYSDLSKVLYVELLNPSGDVMETKKLPVDDKGQAHGEIALDSLYTSGYYEVRAYTRYMTAWGTNAVFSRVFPVFKAPKVEGDYSDRTIRTMLYKHRDPNNREDEDSLYTKAIEEGIYTNNLAKNVTVRFYPEGGDMIAGVKGKVALCAVDDNGYPFSMMGQVVDEQENTLAIVETDSTGKGMFDIIPTEGMMTLVTVNKKDKVRRFDLPLAKKEGCALSLDAVSDSMSVTMRFSKALCGKAAGYVIMNRGTITACDTMTTSPTIMLSLDRAAMHEGVNQFTVFSDEGKILAERMFFICPKTDESEKISMTAKQERLAPCGKVTLDVETCPNTTFSFSAIDAKTMNNGKNGNIKTWMLLSSEVKGYIHNPDYYFESDDHDHREKADMLMLTQGWRRYDWQVMTGVEKMEYKPTIEDSFYLRGKLYPFRKRNTVENVSLSAYLYNRQGQNLKGHTATDEHGNYAFRLPFMDGDWKMELFTQKDNGKGMLKKKTYRIAIDRQFSPAARYITPDEASIIHPNVPNLFRRHEKGSFSAEAEEEEDDAIIKSISNRDKLIKTVKVKAPGWRYFVNDDFQYKNESWGRRFATLHYDAARELDIIRDMGEEEPTVFEFLVRRNRLFEANEGFPGLKNAPTALDTDDNQTQTVSDERNPYYKGDNAPRIRERIQNISRGWMTYAGRPILWYVNNGMTHVETGYTDQSIASLDYAFPFYLKEVKSIYVVPYSPSTIEANMSIVEEPLVRVYLYTYNIFSSESQKGIRHTHFQGFNIPETFKTEDYTNLPPMEDFRRTLYWAPDVTTDSTGHATIEFWNNSSCKEMFISAEGVTKDGQFVVYE